MQFDQYTVVALMRPSTAPQLDEAAAGAIQDVHLAHLADLHDAGYLLAAGPILGDESFRGLCIFKVGPQNVRELMEQDPAVLAGLLSITILPWMVPSGAMSFSSTRFPRSMADVEAE